MGGKRPGRFREGHRRNRTFGAWAGFAVTVAAGRMDAAGAFKKSEIPCRIGKASFVLRAWIGNSWGARVMSQRAGTAEAEIKTLIEAWADAVRRHDLPAILAHHDDDIVMFDVPPPLQSRGITRRPGICSSPITNLGKPSTSKSYKCASETPSPLRSPSCVAGRLQSVALPCRVASSFD